MPRKSSSNMSPGDKITIRSPLYHQHTEDDIDGDRIKRVVTLSKASDVSTYPKAIQAIYFKRLNRRNGFPYKIVQTNDGDWIPFDQVKIKFEEQSKKENKMKIKFENRDQASKLFASKCNISIDQSDGRVSYQIKDTDTEHHNFKTVKDAETHWKKNYYSKTESKLTKIIRKMIKEEVEKSKTNSNVKIPNDMTLELDLLEYDDDSLDGYEEDYDITFQELKDIIKYINSVIVVQTVDANKSPKDDIEEFIDDHHEESENVGSTAKLLKYFPKLKNITKKYFMFYPVNSNRPGTNDINIVFSDDKSVFKHLVGSY